MKTHTTPERIQFLQDRIKEYRTVADGFRASALGASEANAAACFENAKIAECSAEQIRRTLAVLFD